MIPRNVRRPSRWCSTRWTAWTASSRSCGCWPDRSAPTSWWSSRSPWAGSSTRSSRSRRRWRNERGAPMSGSTDELDRPRRSPAPHTGAAQLGRQRDPRHRRRATPSSVGAEQRDGQVELVGRGRRAGDRTRGPLDPVRPGEADGPSPAGRHRSRPAHRRRHRPCPRRHGGGHLRARCRHSLRADAPAEAERGVPQ